METQGVIDFGPEKSRNFSSTPTAERRPGVPPQPATAKLASLSVRIRASMACWGRWRAMLPPRGQGQSGGDPTKPKNRAFFQNLKSPRERERAREMWEKAERAALWTAQAPSVEAAVHQQRGSSHTHMFIFVWTSSGSCGSRGGDDRVPYSNMAPGVSQIGSCCCCCSALRLPRSRFLRSWAVAKQDFSSTTPSSANAAVDQCLGRSRSSRVKYFSVVSVCYESRGCVTC